MNRSKDLFELLAYAIESEIQPRTRAELPSLCDSLKLPGSPNNPNLSKRQYIVSRVEKLKADLTLTQIVAKRFIRQFPITRGNEKSFELEEILWEESSFPNISMRVRRELARSLNRLDLLIDPSGLMDALNRLFILETHYERSTTIVSDIMGDILRQESSYITQTASSLKDRILRNFVAHSGTWSVNFLFNSLGEFTCSSKRFGRLVESLVSADVIPHESQQVVVVRKINTVLNRYNLELIQTDIIAGYPSFTVQAVGSTVVGRPKNLVFASSVKPDIRFRDAVNNDIEIVTHADRVLVYDRSIPDRGLLWNDLQDWWLQGRCYSNEREARISLYLRLFESLPTNSPPQQLLFRTFFSHYRDFFPTLPALLPEVWLHYDPKTIEQRGKEALLRQRMDFLLLISPSIRVVIEVDGKHHYTGRNGQSSEEKYAMMVSQDRDLRLSGYEVYRFSASELLGQSGEQIVGDFFDELFKRYGVLSPSD